MVRKCTACNECRTHRRKCIRSSLNEVCDRCKHFDLQCSVPGEIPTDSDGDELEQLIREANDLNFIINQLEMEMKTLKKGQQRQIAYSPTQESSSSSPISPVINNPWKLTIHNGKLRIETGIRNISDLMQSGPIRYLSPRLSADQTNQDLVIHFNIGKTVRLRMLSVRLLAKCINPKPNPTALLLPTSFLFDPTTIIDKLVNVYFKCYGLIRPMLHEPSFMKYYRQHDSPIDSLICLCICSTMCVAPCDHIPYSYQELRSMGDYFAGLAKAKLLDQFDLPEKRLENVIAINMLGDYLYTVLNVSDGLKLISLGHRICEDLKPWYDKELQKPGTPSVECVLFSRHYSIMMSYVRLYDVLVSRKQEMIKRPYLEWKSLPDERPEVIDVIESINLHFQLTDQPVLAKIRFYKHYLNKDSIHSIKFSDIILVDDIIEKWWNSLPSRYRVSGSWLDMQQLKLGIDQSEDLVVLVFLAYFLSYLNDIYATLLTPNDADFILSIVQERSLERCIHCSQLAVYALHRLTKVKSISSCLYMFTANECLSHTLDVLSILSASSNATIREEAKNMRNICIKRIDDMELMRNHIVDPLKSPLLTGMKELDLNNFNPSVYYNYPQPWYAAMYDICHYFEKLNITTEEQIPSPSVSFDLNQ